jgi:hypothetical protein
VIAEAQSAERLDALCTAARAALLKPKGTGAAREGASGRYS